MTAKPKTPDRPNHAKDLILLFVIPLSVILVAAAVIYFPRFLANPGYDFIYSLCDRYDCSNNYRVDSNGYIEKEDSGLPGGNDISELRYYDVETDSTKSLTLEEAKGYKLNNFSKAPDGYSLSRESQVGGFLFWGDTDSGWYLKNGSKKKPVELSSDSSYYLPDIKFLGWVEK